MTIITQLSQIFAQAFAAQKLDPSFGAVIAADRPDLAEFQCNGALQAAKAAKANPRALAEGLVAWLQASEFAPNFAELSIAGPGFINIKLADNFVAQALQALLADAHYQIPQTTEDRLVLLEYVSANVAKELHVGHMRNLIIGDTLRRLLQISGYKLTTDCHLGDWGLPQGILLWQIKQTHPELPYFAANYKAGSCQAVPFDFAQLCKFYPAGAAKSKADEAVLLECQKVTADFQDGDAGLRDLMAVVNKLSIADIKQKTDLFGAYFDTWYGESHMDKYIGPMLADLEQRGITAEIDGAIGVHIAQPDDKFEVPPLILKKSMGGYTYGTTDLATVYQRAQEFDPVQSIIVTDFRQEMHFERFFRAARKAGYGERMQFTHVMYGTINGPDGTPFKTRDGGVPSFDFLLGELFSKARERLQAIGLQDKVSEDEFEKTAQAIGLAAIRFGDMINHRRSDYSFDLEKFVAFEGKTGPYLQYTTVRLKALLAKAAAQNLSAGEIMIDAAQKDLAVLLLQFPQAVHMALADYAPHVLADYCFRLAQLANRFYQATPVLAENDKAKQGSYLALFDATQKMLTCGLDLLGIAVPEQM